MKWGFFQAVAVSVLLYGCTTWTNKMLRVKARWYFLWASSGNRIIQNSSCMATYFPSLKPSKTCWRSKEEFISDALQWTCEHPCVGWPAKSYIHQLCADTECHLEDLPRVMADRDGWQNSQQNLCCQHTFKIYVTALSRIGLKKQPLFSLQFKHVSK